MQLMANVLGREILARQIDHATAVGAAIHGAVAAGVVASYAEGAKRYGATSFLKYETERAAAAAYALLYKQYRALGTDVSLRQVMRATGS